MGFDTLHASLVAACDKGTPRGAIVKRALALPVLVATLRNCYKSLGPIKQPFKARLKAIIEEVSADAPPKAEAAPELGPYLKHLVRGLALHVHASDPDVRRWASVGAALDADPELCETLCAMCDEHQDRRVCDGLRALFDWTLSECIRRGAPIVPYG